MELIGSSPGCRYCGRPLSATGAAVVGAGPPQVLCASCRAASSLDSLVGHGAFASGGIALKVPMAQASPLEPDRTPMARPVPAPGPADAPSADVVIDLTDRAVARAAEAAAVLEEGATAPAAAMAAPAAREVEPDAADPARTEPEPVDADRPEHDRPPQEAIDDGSDDREPVEGGGREDPIDVPPSTDVAGAQPTSSPDVGPGTPPTAPRPVRIPTIRDLTRGTGRPRSAVRRAEPLSPAPRADRRPDPTLDGAVPPGGAPAPPATLDAAAWSGRGLRRPTVIDLRDDATAGLLRTAVGPQWSGANERQAVRDLLDGVAPGIAVLHDRRAPGCLSGVDHLVVAPSGIWVVDSMGFSGRVRAPGGRRRRRSRPALHVGGRDRTPLLADITQRVAAVRTALADGPAGRVPVRGALCFSDEDLGRDAEPFDLAGVLVTSRRHLLTALTAEAVVDDAHRADLLRTLAERLPAIG